MKNPTILLLTLAAAIIIIWGVAAILYYLPGLMPVEVIGPAPSLITRDDFSRSGDNITITLENACFGNIDDTGSMHPIIDKGITVIYERTGNVRIGDIAVYEKDDGFRVIHRIIGEQDGKWIFRGDHSRVKEIIDKSRVIYRVIAIFY